MARILVVAPSNAAVDQLALKLISLRSQLQENLQYNMLRLGVTTSMHPVVKEFSFDRMVEKQRQSQTRCNKASDSLEKDIRAKQMAADNLLSDQIRAENAGRMDLAAKLRRDYKVSNLSILKGRGLDKLVTKYSFDLFCWCQKTGFYFLTRQLQKKIESYEF